MIDFDHFGKKNVPNSDYVLRAFLDGNGGPLGPRFERKHKESHCFFALPGYPKGLHFRDTFGIILGTILKSFRDPYSSQFAMVWPWAGV